MTKLRISPLLLLTACSGQFQGTGSDAGIEDPSIAARAFFSSNVQPILEGNCTACHSGSMAGLAFIMPPSIYDSVMAHPNLVFGGDAPASRLYAYGRSDQHSGPIFTPEQSEIVRQWIDLVPPRENEEPPPITTNRFAPLVGPNTVDLAEMGEGLDGATMTFTMQQLAQGIYISALMVNAGAGGVHLNHPLFVSYCSNRPAKADPVDSFYGLDMIVNAGLTGMVGGGTVILTDFQPGCELSIHFEIIEPGMGGPGGEDGGVGPGGGGCTDVAGFTANARGPISASCGSCHSGGNATARNAWDITVINDLSEAAQIEACGQTRNKINLANEVNSILFQRVAPGQATGHPITLNQGDYDAFRNPVLLWATNEL